MLKQFRIQEIGSLDDGRVALVVNKQLAAMTTDCVNRPGVSAARKVTVVLEMTPVVGENGVCEETNIEVVSHATTPKSRSKPLHMGVRAGGQLVFNDASQDNVHQGTLDQAGDDRDKTLEE